MARNYGPRNRVVSFDVVAISCSVCLFVSLVANFVNLSVIANRIADLSIESANIGEYKFASLFV